jgi:hypoxanthine-guanine phosphoribosyltransferase
MTLDYVDASKVLLNDILDETGYTTKYILEKLYENNPKFVQTLNGNQVVKVKLVANSILFKI